jgi:hypothetical protein
MYNLVGKVIIRKEDQKEFVVIEQHDSKIYINVDGNVKAFSDTAPFKNGYFVAKDDELQEEINEFFDELRAIEAIRRENTINAPTINSQRRFYDSFDERYNAKHLKRDTILTYSQVEKLFGIQILGPGKGINLTNDHLVLISTLELNNGRYSYHDRFDDNGDYLYTGQGQNRDQTLTNTNTHIITCSKTNKPIYLFVKLSSTEYLYQGQVEYVNHEFVDRNVNGRVFNQIEFRLRRIYDENKDILYPSFLTK